MRLKNITEKIKANKDRLMLVGIYAWTISTGGILLTSSYYNHKLEVLAEQSGYELIDPRTRGGSLPGVALTLTPGVNTLTLGALVISPMFYEDGSEEIVQGLLDRRIEEGRARKLTNEE